MLKAELYGHAPVPQEIHKSGAALKRYRTSRRLREAQSIFNLREAVSLGKTVSMDARPLIALWIRRPSSLCGQGKSPWRLWLRRNGCTLKRSYGSIACR